jgi:hypothetical protein
MYNITGLFLTNFYCELLWYYGKIIIGNQIKTFVEYLLNVDIYRALKNVDINKKGKKRRTLYLRKQLLRVNSSSPF